MTIAEAIKSFAEDLRQKSTVQPGDHRGAEIPALLLLEAYFCPNADLNEITASRIRDFAARWYLEEASTLNIAGQEGEQVDKSALKVRIDRARSHQAADIPDPAELLNEVASFLTWTNQRMVSGEPSRCLSIVNELRTTLPRALEINRSLSRYLRETQSAFNFPEFLTSFEEGGSSQYDIDAGGNIGAVDGFFRIVRVEGSLVEAEELISDEKIWPIVFPEQVAPMLNDAYVINLELVLDRGKWQIAGCGFTYPPGTEF
jgi:hypothetical protein